MLLPAEKKLIDLSPKGISGGAGKVYEKKKTKING